MHELLPGRFGIQQNVIAALKRDKHLYKGIKRAIRVEDETRNLTVETTSDQVVVWNPWSEKAKTLDMPPDGYKIMLCIEAANIEPVLSIGPGSSLTLGTRVSVG